jgi:phage gpG-like protein
MNIETLTNVVCQVLKANLVEFYEKEDTDVLSPELATKMIVTIWSFMQEAGGLVMKEFLEGYDINDEVIVGANGQIYRKKYKGRKIIMTTLGEIRYERNVYQQDRGGKSIAPLDIKLNMAHEYFSLEMKEALLYSSAHNTPEETSHVISKFGHIGVSPSSIKKLLEQTGKMIEQHKDQINASIHEKEEMLQGPDISVASLDGVNVRMKDKGQRKGRPKQRPGEELTDSTVSAYKNAMCGSVTNYDIINQGVKLIPIRRSSKYVARMPEAHYLTFRDEFEREIEHMLQTEPQVKLLIIDAHPSLKGYLKDHPLFKEFHQLIDFYHACEHLSKLSEHLFGKESQHAQIWYYQKKKTLKTKHRAVEKITASALHYIRRNKLSKSRVKQAYKEINYFRKLKNLMNYYLHIQNGWPIGSGIVEAACKSIVKQRMCRSGQTWTIPGGQVVLDLRTYVKSNRWNLFFNQLTMLNTRKCA